MDYTYNKLNVFKGGSQISSTTPICVCLVAPLPPPNGGMGTWTRLVYEAAQECADIRIDLVDISPRWRAIDDLGLFKRIIGGGIQLLRDCWRLRCVMKCGVDVIHLTTPGQLAIVRDLVMLGIARLTGIPVVYHLHFGRVSDIAKNNTREWRMLQRAINLCSAVIAIDPDTAATVTHHCPNVRCLRIANGLRIDKLPVDDGGGASQHTVLFLGWVIPTKGVGELVEAWSSLGSEKEGWRCVIAGGGSLEYREQLSQKFQPKCLEFLAELSHDDAMRLMATCDVVVLPSHTEGFPMVIVEAMAMGKAIIATNVGAIPELLSDECGLLIEVNNADELSKALREMISDSSLRMKLGKNAQRKAHHELSMNVVFGQLLNLWRQLASR